MNQLPTNEEREKLILETMQASLTNDLDEWERRRKSNKIKNEKFEQDYQKEKMRWTKEKADIFDWLSIKTG